MGRGVGVGDAVAVGATVTVGVDAALVHAEPIIKARARIVIGISHFFILSFLSNRVFDRRPAYRLKRKKVLISSRLFTFPLMII